MRTTQYTLISAIAGFFFILGLWIVATAFSWTSEGTKSVAASGGELNFTIRTVTAGGNYSPKHVLAIWVEKEGDFVKTRLLRGNQRKQYLYTWKASSNYNVVDAITGSTLTSHQTHTVSWDCTDLDGNIIEDGDYVVLCEFTEQHAQGPLYSLEFTKGPDAMTLTPADETYFKDIELDFTPIVSDFSYDNDEICQWETVTFDDESVNATSWEWDFGEGSAPATANTAGPHTVYYTTGGIKTVSLTINGNLTETKEDLIAVYENPVADFSYSADQLTVEFTNLSQSAQSYVWDFGDGTTSTEVNPTHTYSGNGTYTAVLGAHNGICEDYISEEIVLTPSGTSAFTDASFAEVYPNPNKGFFYLKLKHPNAVTKIDIFAPSGDKVEYPGLINIEKPLTTIDVQNLEKGIYFLRIESKNRIFTEKIVVR